MKHLLLDPRVVAAASAAELVPGAVVKEPANPLLVEDQPWEVRFDNLYPNVVRDADGRWRCWYSPFIVDEVTASTPPERRAATRYAPAAREMGLCYAWSPDGLRWHKPDLGVCELSGSARNNIVLRGPHGSGVVRDDRDADPARRYKLLCAGEAGGAMAVAWSADGLRWPAPRPCPEMGAIGDTHNNALWVPQLECYVAFTRLWSEGAYQGVRVVGRSESPDFRDWTPAVPVLEGLDAARQVYAMPVFAHGDGYLGLPMIFDTAADRVHVELAWSADTVAWRRLAPGCPLIPCGPAGAWDWGCVYAAACPIVLPGEIRAYYAGSDDVHGGWRAGGLGLARLRPDGFAGYRAVPGAAGEVVTHVLPCGPGPLTVNLSGGAAEVGVLDESGRLCAESLPIAGDGPALPAAWAAGDLRALAGRPVRLRFRLRDATLYAFEWGAP